MFFGSFVATVTPFTEKRGKLVVDYETLGGLIDFHVENGTDGIVVGGCTGESFTLTHKEQRELISFVAREAGDRIKVIAGTGSNSTAEAIELTQHAAKAGASAAMVITPYANKPTHDGLMTHYRAIAESASLPIMLYNVPSRTGLKMTPETVDELFESVPNVVAIKEASGDVNQTSKILTLCDIVVLSGDDPLTLPLMSVGAQGVVSVTANVAPALVKCCVEQFQLGDTQGAATMHQRLFPLHQAMFIETNPGPVKAAMQYLRLIENDACRPPLAPMRPEKRAQLVGTLEKVLNGSQ